MRPSATATPLAVAGPPSRSGTVFIARTPETFTYDADGNMTSDGRFRYFWNGENRLVCASNVEVVVTYAYDHRGRMVRKEISHRGTEARRIEYLWDDWNIIREIQWPVTSDQWSVGTLATGHWPLVTDYVWGLDIDGTLQGAGGVGGLLAVIRDDGVFFPTYDANGNISEYVSTNGTIVAHYDYSPFGEPLVASGELAATFTHQFSTKPYCAVTGFSEYQMRKYRPGIGRWLSRDPIEEEGGFHLYLFCSNNQVHNHDAIGLWSGIDDLVFTVSGAVIGATSRIISDIVMGNDLSWQGIVGSAIGGAVAGELLLYAPGASIYLLAGIGATSGKSINVIHKRSSLIIIK